MMGELFAPFCSRICGRHPASIEVEVGGGVSRRCLRRLVKCARLRWDLVAYIADSEGGVILLTRLVALPGERLRLADGHIYGPNEFFFIGDNIDSSIDSRSHGPVLGSRIVGVADL